MNDREHLQSLQTTVNLLMMESNKFIDNHIRSYAKECGFIIKEGRQGVVEFNNLLESKGLQMKIEVTDLNMNEDKQGVIQAVQELRVKIIPKLGGN